MRIAIVRLTSLGDVVHTLPVASAIRAARPDARIVWIVEEHEQVLLRDNPSVDEVIVAPLRRWRRRLGCGAVLWLRRELGEFVAAVRSPRVDVAIDVQGWVHKTSPIVLLTGAPVRIGFDRRYARDPWSPLFTTQHVSPPAEAAHVVDQNLALLAPLGFGAAAASFVLPQWADAAGRVDAWMAERSLTRPLVLLPSTRGRRKLWPAASYAALARRLLAVWSGARVVLAGGPGDRAVFDAVRSHGLDTEIYAPEAVADLATFLGRAALVVGNDTGPLHLAAAASVPSLGLFGPTSGRRNGPYGPTGAFIQSRSGRMADISVDEAFSRAIAMLENR